MKNDDTKGNDPTYQDPGDQLRTHRQTTYRRTSGKAAKGDPLFDDRLSDQPGMDHPGPSPGTPPRILAVAEDPPPITTHPTLSERTEDLTLLGCMIDTLAGRLVTGHWCKNCMVDLIALATHHTWQAADHPAT